MKVIPKAPDIVDLQAEIEQTMVKYGSVNIYQAIGMLEAIKNKLLMGYKLGNNNEQ